MSGLEPRYLSVAEAAAILGVHRNTILSWVRDKTLDSARLPGSRSHRFDERDIQRLLRRRGEPVDSLADERITVGPELVDAGQIGQWAKSQQRDAQQKVPELVADLLTSTGAVVVTSLPSGDGVASEGWDGVGEVAESPFLPPGPFALEIGTSVDIRRKAEADYAKRTANPLGLEPSNTTFVFVTPHRWTARASWAAEKNGDGIWRAVIVIDGDEIARWLREAPAVHVRFSEYLGRRPRDVTTLEAWWERFRTQTNPPLPASLFVAGRESASTRLAEFLAGPPSVLTIRSESQDDALAFVAAATARDHDVAPRPAIMLIQSRTVWEEAVARKGRAILVPQFRDADLASAQRAGHHALLAVGRDQSITGVPLELPKPTRTGAAQAFEEADIPYQEAYRLAALARRSLPALIRTCARDPRLAEPEWAQSPDASLLAALALVGSWAPIEADHAVIEQIAGRDWASIEERLVFWRSASAGAPFVLTGGQWHVASAEDVFALVGPKLSASMLQRWSGAARSLLPELDPLVDLAEEERWTAQFRGVSRERSHTLRTGVARGVAFLGSLEDLEFNDGTSARRHAAVLVRDILSAADSDDTGAAWRSLADVLPLLAEAAPDTFLDTVLESLDSHPGVIASMFRDRDQSAIFGGFSPHVHLLWALESLCWSEDHLLDAVRVIARLDALDHRRGQRGNRPLESLKEVLVPWVRQTAASLATRTKALEVVLNASPGTGWDLLMGLWPNLHSSTSAPATPRFRDWLPDTREVTVGEHYEFVTRVVELGLEHVGGDVERWGAILGRLANVGPASRHDIVQRLQALIATDALDADGRLSLWRAMRETIGHHREFPEAEWSMDAETVATLDRVADAISPASSAVRDAYLFDWRPDLVDIHRAEDRAGHEGELERRRRAAIEATIDSQGLDGLTTLIQQSPQPHLTGRTAGEMPLDELEDTFISWLGDPDEALAGFAHAWAIGRAHNSPEWLIKALASPAANDPVRKARLAIAAPDTRSTWNLLKQDPVALDYYWRNLNAWRVDEADLEEAVDALIAHSRPAAAIELVAHSLHGPDDTPTGVSVELARKALNAVRDATEIEEPIKSNLGYDIGRLLSLLDEQGTQTEVVASYEFVFHQLLQHHRAPRALYRVLGDDPVAFVDLVSRLYRGKNDPSREPTERESQLARHAWSVLHDWRRLPGLRDDGTVDAAHLNAWIGQARSLFAERDRTDIGDEKIGEVLSSAPNGADGAWPHEAVRDVLEIVGNAHIDSGMYLGRVNNRGVISRDPHGGGALEWKLAAECRKWSKAMSATHRRTAGLLRRLADSYEDDARREDKRSELQQDLD